MDQRRDYAILKRSVHGLLREREPMAGHTTYRIGGPADLYVEPAGREDLRTVLRFLDEFQVSGFFLGGGSNLLVSDQGIRGVVIRLNRCCRESGRDGTRLDVGAGNSLEAFLDRAEREGLGGAEFLADIPGTVGGALRMNAGAWGGEIGQRVEEIEVLDPGGGTRRLDRSQLSFHYRETRGLGRSVILGVRLALDRMEPGSIRQERSRLKALRRERLPLELPSCGSVFKRTDGSAPPGRLIEEAGCKGLRAGDAEVSRKHANFILNLGAATAQDVRSLILEVRRRVFNRCGIALALEVELVGEFPEETQPAASR